MRLEVDNMSVVIRVHFDGKTIVPDEPVDLPINQSMEAEFRIPEPKLAAEEIARRLEALRRLEATVVEGAEAQPKTYPELDPRFNSYIQLFNNLDNLIWQMPRFFMAALAVLLACAAAMLGRQGIPAPRLAWYVLFAFAGWLSLVAIYCTGRIRAHHSVVGDKLLGMDTEGYFGERPNLVRNWLPPSAHHAFMSLFAFVAIGCGAMIIYLLTK
jgi:hypothetical protein